MFNNLLIAKRVHLAYNLGWNSTFCILFFTINHHKETASHPYRSDNQSVPVTWLRISGQHIENSGCILTIGLLTGQKSTVRIMFGSTVIVIASAKMNITSYTILFPANNESNLTMGFQSNHTIDDMASCLLQHLRPDNIMLFIKSGLELYQNCNLFSILSSLCECCNNGGITTDAIEGLLNRKYIWVNSSLSNQINNGSKGFIGMLKDDIPLTNLVKKIRARKNSRIPLRLKIRKIEILSPFLVRNLR